jgi:hypothetical protein
MDAILEQPRASSQGMRTGPAASSEVEPEERNAMLRTTSLFAVSIALIALAVVIAPDPRERGSAAARPNAADTFVGRVQGTEAFIALTYDGERLQAYACNGSARRPATISAWFESPWDGDGSVTIVNGGARLRAEHVDGQITGQLDGHRFTAVRATGSAGLYERDGRRSVVLADGSVRGTIVSPRPIKCRPVQTTLVDGTTQIVTVCRPA